MSIRNCDSIRRTIIVAQKAYCAPDWRWENLQADRPDLVLWLVQKGRGQLVNRQGTFKLGPGDCFVFRQSEPHVATHDPENPLVVPYVVYQHVGRNGKPYRAGESELPRWHQKVENLSFFSELVERVIRLSAEGTSSHGEALYWLETCLRELAYQQHKLQHAQHGGFDLQRIDDICQEILDNPAGIDSIESLAGRLEYSTDHFIRVFKKYKGVTPGEYWIRARMDAAVGLLRFSDFSITQIASQLGYGEIFAFSKQFRKRMGISPTDYRRKYR